VHTSTASLLSSESESGHEISEIITIPDYQSAIESRLASERDEFSKRKQPKEKIMEIHEDVSIFSKT
jgi:hypothetical protein